MPKSPFPSSVCDLLVLSLHVMLFILFSESFIAFLIMKVTDAHCQQI